jgi:chemotaxis protein CheC
MPIQVEIEDKMSDRLQTIAGVGMTNAARGFSRMLGREILVTDPALKVVSILDLPSYAGGLENEAIGIYLRTEGDVSAQIMLIIPFQKALELVDMLMEMPPGSTTEMGTLERSALGEVGNLTGTFFWNAVAEATGSVIRPTPPAVMVDMVGAILDIIIATSGGVGDQVLLMRANFVDGDRSVGTDFWVIPDVSFFQRIRGV